MPLSLCSGHPSRGLDDDERGDAACGILDEPVGTSPQPVGCVARLIDIGGERGLATNAAARERPAALGPHEPVPR
jgi:hypothetical protein